MCIRDSAIIDDGSCSGYFGCMEESYFEYDSNASCHSSTSCLNTWQDMYNDQSDVMSTMEVEMEEATITIDEMTTMVDNLSAMNEDMTNELEVSELENQSLSSTIATMESQMEEATITIDEMTTMVDDLSAMNDELILTNDSLLSPIYIDLIAGWNIIGFSVKNSQDAVASFNEIEEILSVVKNNAGEVYWPEFGFNGIGDLVPGQGYQIRVDEAYEDFYFQDLDGLRIEIQPTVPQWAIDMEMSIHPNDIRTLVRVVNSLGQEVNPDSEFEGTLLYYLYNDGSVEKHLK